MKRSLLVAHWSNPRKIEDSLTDDDHGFGSDHSYGYYLEGSPRRVETLGRMGRWFKRAAGKSRGQKGTVEGQELVEGQEEGFFG